MFYKVYELYELIQVEVHIELIKLIEFIMLIELIKLIQLVDVIELIETPKNFILLQTKVVFDCRSVISDIILEIVSVVQNTLSRYILQLLCHINHLQMGHSIW